MYVFIVDAEQNGANIYISIHITIGGLRMLHSNLSIILERAMTAVSFPNHKFQQIPIKQVNDCGGLAAAIQG